MEDITLDSIDNFTINKTVKFYTTYDKTINEVLNLNYIIRQIPLVFLEKLNEVDEDNKIIFIRYVIEQIWDKCEKISSDIVVLGKITFIRYVIEQIWDRCEKIYKDRCEKISRGIYLWDFNLKISEYKDLIEIFTTTSKDKTLPISATSDNIIFKRIVKEEFINGLLLFSHIKGATFNTSIFDINIEKDFVREFITGFITGSLWSMDNHHVYWS